MCGVDQRPSTGCGKGHGGAGAIPALLVVIALLAGCASPAPSPSSGEVSATPSATGASPAASGSPSPWEPTGTPHPSPTPGDWTRGVELGDPAAVATLEAVDATVAGVMPGTAFRLAALDGSDPVELASMLTTEPAVDLAIGRDGDAALVQPRRPLESGQPYRFDLVAADGSVRGSWAMQVIAPLAIVSTTPDRGATNVPPTTGIEIKFNEPGVTAIDAERYIEIVPAVAGRFEQANRTIAFVPDAPLASSTLYSVTVRAGLPLAGSPLILGEDFRFRFETAGGLERPLYTWIPDRLLEARPTDLAVIPIDVEPADGPDPHQVAVTVHRLADMPAAIEAWRAIEQRPGWLTRDVSKAVPTDDLPLVLSGTLALRKLPGWGSAASTAVQLPRELDEGWYLVTFAPDQAPGQVVLQVGELAAYAATTITDSLAWVNDLATQTPVAGATIRLDGATLATTDARGIATWTTPDSLLAGAGQDEDDEDWGGGGRAPVQALEIGAGSAAVFVPAGATDCGLCYGAAGGNSWWLVFEPDRTEYRPSDTISAWGIVRSRTTGAAPASVEVRLVATGDSDDHITVMSELATPDAKGAFLVPLTLTDLPYGSYDVQLWIDGSRVTGRQVQVSVIRKPAWFLQVNTDHRAVVSGDGVAVSARATFFEGTPVAGVQLRLRGSGTAVQVATDTAGAAAGRVTLRLPAWRGQLGVNGVTAAPTLPEEAEIRSAAEVMVFQSSVILRGRAVLNGGKVVITGTVHDVALARYDAADAHSLWDVDPYGAVRSGQVVTVRAVETTTTTEQTGTRYDWIRRQTVPVYRTVEHTRDLGTRTLRTGADGSFRTTFPAGSRDRTYKVTVKAADSLGRTTKKVMHASTPVSWGDPDYARLKTQVSGGAASVGDTVGVSFLGGGRPAGAVRYLWIRALDGLRAVEVTTAPRDTFTFREDDIPGLTIGAVRFDGHGYTPVEYGARVPFRLADRALTVTVTADRATYRPGGQVTLAIRTTDGASKPVAASVYLNVVDEKLVAMGLVNIVEPLDRLYEEVGPGIVGITFTHPDPTRSSGGDGWGDATGGGGVARTDFRDWLASQIVRTGPDGRATVTVDLSDDLTSWHAFAYAVSGSLRAGRGEALIPVSLPMFADATVAAGYLEDDRPVVRVRAFGVDLQPGDRVLFTLSSKTLDMDAVTVTADAFEAASVLLPALTTGTHRLRIEARATTAKGERTDVLVRTFEVVARRATQWAVASATLDEPASVPAGTGFTTLTVVDGGRGRVLPLLETLASGETVRGDQALAAGVAARVLRDAFGLDPDPALLGLDLDLYLRDEGYAVLGYASSEIDLTALAAMTDDPRLGTLGQDLAWADPRSREEELWVLAGLAAAGAPVLADIRERATLADLTVPEEVALANAALAAGDEELAGRFLRVVLAAAGERRGAWVRVATDTPGDEGIVLTARLAIVAASLGEPVATAMDAYLDANPPERTVIALERALAARGWARRIPAGDASATLTIGQQRSELRVVRSRAVRVSLTPAQAAVARLEPVSGTPVVTTRVDRPLDTSTLVAPLWLVPARTVSPSGTIGLADTVTVQIQVQRPPDASAGCLLVTEFVPSGLVPVDASEHRGGAGRPWRITGQRVEFCLRHTRKNEDVTLRYLARVLGPGTYVWEPTVLQLAGATAQGVALPASTVTIGNRP